MLDECLRKCSMLSIWLSKKYFYFWYVADRPESASEVRTCPLPSTTGSRITENNLSATAVAGATVRGY